MLKNDVLKKCVLKNGVCYLIFPHIIRIYHQDLHIEHINQGWAMGPGSHGTAVPGRQSRAWDWDRD